MNDVAPLARPMSHAQLADREKQVPNWFLQAFLDASPI